MSGTAHLPQIAKIASVAREIAYESITVAPMSPHIGAEIGGIDLTRPLANKQVEELHDAFARYPGDLFPRSEDQLVRGSGPPRRLRSARSAGMSARRRSARRTDNELVRKFHYDETSKQISGENFHSATNPARPIPPLGTMLYNHTIPPDGGGDTMFASMYAAHDALSDRA